AVTLTVRLAELVSGPSDVCRTMVLAPVAAVQPAAMFAVIVPLVLTMFEIVRPSGTVVAVTTRLPAAMWSSLTVAMVELEAAEPCCRVMGEAGLMVGD